MQPIALTQSLRDYYNGLSNTPSSRDAESQINQFNKMAPRSTDILAGYETQAGVDSLTGEASTLQKNILNTENLLNAVPDAIATRTSNALVSGAQAQRLTAAEQDPISKQLGVLSTRYQGVQNDLGNARDRASKYATLDIGDIGTWRDSLTGRLNAALQREEQERQAAEQARQLKALQDMIAAQNAAMNARLAEYNRQAAAARQSYLATQQQYKLFQQSYNPQQTISAQVLQPTISGTILQPARTVQSFQPTISGTKLQGSNPGMNLNMSGSGGISLGRGNTIQGIPLR